MKKKILALSICFAMLVGIFCSNHSDSHQKIQITGYIAHQVGGAGGAVIVSVGGYVAGVYGSQIGAYVGSAIGGLAGPMGGIAGYLIGRACGGFLVAA
jgi:hypothetical membrane protein